jgi:ABC-type amino acid transport substrate-binding protein
MNLLIKNTIFVLLFFITGVSNAENIKLFIHASGSLPHKYALVLKPVAQKTGDNLIIEAVPGVDWSGVARSFKNEKGPAMAMMSGTTLAKGIKDGRYKIEDYTFGNILYYNQAGLICKKPCEFKSFEDVIGNTRKTLKIGVSTSAVTKNLFEELKKSGVKAIMVPYAGGSEALPDLMSGTLDLISAVLSDNKNENIEFIGVPKKYGIQTETWVVILYKNIPEQKFLKWYTDKDFVGEMKIPKNVTETNYLKLLNETVKNIQ